MRQTGGHAEPPDGVKACLSALPDEVLVLILECLDTTAEAVRTSVLALRWPRLWPLLSKLSFRRRPDGYRIRELLDVPDAPELRYISVTHKGSSPDSATAWLTAAASRLTGGLVYTGIGRYVENDEEDPHLEKDEEEKAWRGGNIQLPCFEKATTIDISGDAGLFRLVLPSVGVFTRLTDLSLSLIDFHGPCELGNVVSSPRCPCLQKLSISFALGLHHFSIHSESLLQMELSSLSLRHLTIVTPILQKFSVHRIFFDDDLSEPVSNITVSANITAPQIVSLAWMDRYDPQYFHLNLGQLQELHTDRITAYGFEFNREDNDHSLRLLQQFQVLYSLHLKLSYAKDMSYYYHYQYLLGDITLPQIMFLQLDLCNEGHAFGASLFHLLGMCIGLKGLLLKLSTDSTSSEDEFVCPSECICDQPKNWKNGELVLDHLEDVHIKGLQGVEHDVAFVQRLLGWATVLKTLRLTFDSEVIEGKIEEFREALAGLSRPETCLQFDKK